MLRSDGKNRVTDCQNTSVIPLLFECRGWGAAAPKAAGGNEYAEWILRDVRTAWLSGMEVEQSNSRDTSHPKSPQTIYRCVCKEREGMFLLRGKGLLNPLHRLNGRGEPLSPGQDDRCPWEQHVPLPKIRNHGSFRRPSQHKRSIILGNHCFLQQ